MVSSAFVREILQLALWELDSDYKFTLKNIINTTKINSETPISPTIPQVSEFKKPLFP